MRVPATESFSSWGVRPPEPSGWQLATFSGRLAELSGGPATATLTLAFGLVLEAQKRSEPVAWITDPLSSFFPPDVFEAGIDLDALVVVRVPKRSTPRAADHLLRSGGFGLVVLDLGRSIHVPIPIQARLAGLAKKHHTALLCLTEKSRDLPSLGSLVSLRLEASRTTREAGTTRAEGRFRCEAKILKDKRCGKRWQHLEVCRGPAGLC